VAAVKGSPPWRHFLRLGIEHIVTGYDHVLFLLGLLVVGSSLASAWRIITSFTVAHSITLALATLNVVQLSPRLVEPLIAASIVYVGLENLWDRPLHRRWLLTFGFGLVHGLGFASVLRELSFGIQVGGEVMIPLLAFNVGVELGQVAIALVVLPLIWYLQRLPHFSPRLATICSALVVLAGTYWLVERTVLN
jgi:hydrogenase/urease accessory protein HupE